MCNPAWPSVANESGKGRDHGAPAKYPRTGGYEICLTTDASALVTDAVVEMGNPADSTFAVKMIERQKEQFGKAPKEVTFDDGGFASRSNLAAIKELGVRDAAFRKCRGIPVNEMTSSERIFKEAPRLPRWH